MKHTKLLLSTTALSLSIATPAVLAAGNWDLKLDAQASYGKYYGSELRDNTWTAGLFMSADYADSWGVTGGYNRTKVTYKQGIDDLKQNTWYLSGRKHLQSDALYGRFTFRLDGYLINNDDPTKNTDDGRIIAPMISYMSDTKDFYFDIGYTRSAYNGDLDLNQITPTLGFAFNDQYDWVQLRGYFISSKNQLRTQGENSTTAIEGKLFHYFKPGALLGIDRLQLTAMGGSRVFAVDSDTASVYNLADVQQGSLSLGGKWDIGDAWSVQAFAGYEKYKNKDIDDKYDNRYVYLNLSGKF